MSREVVGEQENGKQAITVALMNDYDVIIAGTARMFDQYRDRIEVVKLGASRKLLAPVDVALYDTFAKCEPGFGEVQVIAESGLAGKVVIASWNPQPSLIEEAFEHSADAYMPKDLPAGDLVEALEAVHGGEGAHRTVFSRARRSSVGLDWPGRNEGLSGREAEILALITQGKSNLDIATTLHVSINSIKTQIRSTYAKISATNRVEAVLWGLRHGFEPDRTRVHRNE